MWGALFPGQGSQHVGMGKFLFDNFKSVQMLFEESSDTLKQDMKKLCFDGPEEDLALTENTQPAILLVSTAAFEVVREVSSKNFAFAAGHSVGEYAAVVTSQALHFIDALQAVKSRGKAMQSAVPLGKGGMLALIGLTPEQVDKFCLWATETSGLGPLEPANFNAPGQIVVSGSQELIEWAQENFKSEIFEPAPKRVRLIPLNVSAPFHCSMMKPAEEKMKDVLDAIDFTNATTPIIQNVNAQIESDAVALKHNLILQISSPVRWVECMTTMIENGVNKGVELGSGQVLKGLAKKINADFKIYNLNSLEDLKVLESV